MKLRDHCPQLQDAAVVKAMVIRSVFASMALEDEAVSLACFEALYAQTAPTPFPAAMSPAREQQNMEWKESWREDFATLSHTNISRLV